VGKSITAATLRLSFSFGDRFVVVVHSTVDKYFSSPSLDAIAFFFFFIGDDNDDNDDDD